jgi:hypothetical protein
MGEQNISMQQLKQQRVTPAEKFVLDAIKGAKPNKPDEDGDVSWYDKDGRWLFEQDFKHGCLWVNYYIFCNVLENEYGITHREMSQFLSKLLYKYTNNGELVVKDIFDKIQN